MPAVTQTTTRFDKSAENPHLATAALVLGLSIAALVPCFWQRNVINGDLGSHLYNAWLAVGIERGDYPGLYLEPVHTNVLFDIVLQRLLHFFQPPTVERLALSMSVLVFFWGTFAAVRVLSGARAWTVTPLILILTHGWVLQVGFMNFHLATGIALFALALMWSPSVTRAVISCLLLVLAVMAQPMPPVWVGLAIAYKALYRWKWLQPRLMSIALAISAFCAVAIRAGWFPTISQTTGWEIGQLLYATGADQAVAYGPEYRLVAVLLLALAAFAFAQYSRREKQLSPNRIIAHLWILLAVGTFLMPDGILFRGYQAGYYFISQRISELLAVVGIAALAAVRPQPRIVFSFAFVAAIFFAMLYRDTQRLNIIQSQVTNIARHYPPGQRFVTDLTDWRPKNQAPSLQGMLGRACVDQCLDYGNYEASTHQFRVRARGPNVFVRSALDRDPVDEFRQANPQLQLIRIKWCKPASDTLCISEIPHEPTR